MRDDFRPAIDRRSMLAAALALGAPGAASAASAAGLVTAADGAVSALQGPDRRDLSPRSPIFVGDRVATAEAARASIRLGTATTLRLGERARITIDRYLVEAGGTVTLGSGPLLVDKDPAGRDGALSIRSAYGLIAIRGTRFYAGPSNGVFGVFVVRGRVAVRAGGTEVLLASGEGTDIARPGARPTVAKPWGQARIDAALASVA